MSTKVIRGITLHQPWAWCICHSTKRIENRTWSPPYALGSFLAIHAGKTIDQEAIATLRSYGIHVPAATKLERGAIVAVAMLDRVINETNIDSLPGDQKLWWSGPVGWLLKDVVSIRPLACKGAQGLWEIQADVLPELRERWRIARGIPKPKKRKAAAGEPEETTDTAGEPPSDDEESPPPTD